MMIIPLCAHRMTEYVGKCRFESKFQAIAEKNAKKS